MATIAFVIAALTRIRDQCFATNPIADAGVDDSEPDDFTVQAVAALARRTR
jgi:hypothetical protein